MRAGAVRKQYIGRTGNRGAYIYPKAVHREARRSRAIRAVVLNRDRARAEVGTAHIIRERIGRICVRFLNGEREREQNNQHANFGGRDEQANTQNAHGLVAMTNKRDEAADQQQREHDADECFGDARKVGKLRRRVRHHIRDEIGWYGNHFVFCEGVAR